MPKDFVGFITHKNLTRKKNQIFILLTRDSTEQNFIFTSKNARTEAVKEQIAHRVTAPHFKQSRKVTPVNKQGHILKIKDESLVHISTAQDTNYIHLKKNICRLINL